ncbi:cation diffusion facilitator family transporter [Methanoplanus limicola]|uniref:Cation diffusion facilitator family transporter n=1 Tax=Methanoplanus limicola DSM 2279 TaxID=937775 RepID=H1Z381_9EURY|nr:cation diffusion facilitator family transporter [Methanoplanus limicola]EHQ36496.1 cation diffusion facilitator family transporter [Methanoplanus limicola DSM 2279]
MIPADQNISPEELKESTARLSILSNSGLFTMKLIVGVSIGSVSIISEAIHSGMDLLASVIAFISVRKSAEPPDHEHEFGHGKFEDISGLIEALLIFIAAILIIFEAVSKLTGGGHAVIPFEMLMAGIVVMGISATVNWFVSEKLMKVGKDTESIALESDAWHLRTDVYTSLGVFAGLILIQITGITALDSVIAIGVALVILKAAFDLTKRTLHNLIDRSIPERDKDRIKEIICEHSSKYAGFHDLRTRRAGPQIFINFHLVVAGDVSVQQSHDLTDHLESDIKFEYPRSVVTIHVEPCNEGCRRCGSFCNYK